MIFGLFVICLKEFYIINEDFLAFLGQIYLTGLTCDDVQVLQRSPSHLALGRVITNYTLAKMISGEVCEMSDERFKSGKSISHLSWQSPGSPDRAAEREQRVEQASIVFTNALKQMGF